MNHNRNTQNQVEENQKPEKDKVNIYDNDDAYMLNDDDKDLELIDSGNREEGAEQYEYDEEEGELLNADPRGGDRQDGLEDRLSEDGTIRNELLNNPNNIANSNGSNSKTRSKSISNLITLKYISVCQCCKENFNSNSNVPFLLKCGHFFCKTCLVNNFTEEDGRIFCPDDGLIANSISDLKLLNNLIIDRTVDDEGELISSNRDAGFCEIHPGQKLSHYVEDTREVICVYCAFTKFKKNPKYEIKEIKDKCAEILTDVDKILSDNQYYVEILQSTLKDIKENKVNEEDRVGNLYDEVIKYLEERRNEMFENINNMFASNADKLSEKLDYFSNKMEDAEELKAHIVAVMNSNSYQIKEVLDTFSGFIRENNDAGKLNLELVEFKFSHDDENKLIKYLNNFGDLKSKTKFIRFAPKNNNLAIGINSNLNTNNIMNTNVYNQQNFSNNENTGLDYQFKNVNLNTNSSKKHYDVNYNSNNKFNKNYEEEVLNTSELVNENNSNNYLGRGDSKINSAGNFLIGGGKDLITSDPNFRPPSSKQPQSNYSNFNRNEGVTAPSGINSKYNYSRANDYSYESKNRDFNFSGNSNYSKTPDSNNGKNLRK